MLLLLPLLIDDSASLARISSKRIKRSSSTGDNIPWAKERKARVHHVKKIRYVRWFVHMMASFQAFFRTAYRVYLSKLHSEKVFSIANDVWVKLMTSWRYYRRYGAGTDFASLFLRAYRFHT